MEEYIITKYFYFE